MTNGRLCRSISAAAIATALLLPGCGAGGGHGTAALPAITGSTKSAPRGETAASVTIDIPARRTSAAATRKAAYVSPSIQSVVLSAVGGGTTVANLTAGSPGCATQTPAVSYFDVPPPSPSDGSIVSNIAAGPDGNMWFISGYSTSDGYSISTGGHMYNITGGGTITAQQWLYGYKPSGLVAGPNLALWTVGQDYPLGFGNPTPYGDLVEVPIEGTLAAFPAPAGILPRGSLTDVGSLIYFAAGTNNYSPGFKIGTIDSGGNFLISNNTSADDFVPQSTGPDGLPWGFATTNTGSQPAKLIGAIPTLYDVGYSVAYVAPGADGNMWYTATASDSGTLTRIVGKVSTSGTGIATYAISSGALPGPLTAGPDGNVWFVETSPNAIARVTPGGVITEFPVSYVPQYIAAGPDGNLWFTEVNAGNGVIGRLTPPGTECTVTLDVPVAAPTGSASTVVAEAYDGPNGTGNVLGYASMPFTATAAGPNVINFTLNGVVANLKIAVSTQAALVIGQANSIPLIVTAFDADGNTIIPPGAYSDPSGNALTITLTDSDTSGATSISGGTVTAPGQATSPTLNYTGAGGITATISATITGGTISGTVTGTSLTSH